MLENALDSSSEESEMLHTSFLDRRVMMAMRFETQTVLSRVMLMRASTSPKPKNCPVFPLARDQVTRGMM
jgi:hypothetical protein